MIVSKFGGSSVADAEQINKIKKIINSGKKRRYVVVSAPGKRSDGDSKVTDILYACHANKGQNIPYEEQFEIVAQRFLELELELGVNVNMAKELKLIKKNLDEGTTSDYMASRGEYLNAKVIAAYLGRTFVDTANYILFDDKGRFLEEETNRALGKALKKVEKAVIPGFYGSMTDGTIKTFSRGGSDITGSLVARAVEAELYENWTDVSGFLMADPRIVKNPKPIATISYKELRELSYMGATVLHEDAIYPVRASGIPINIRNTNKPEEKGTIITAEPAKVSKEQIITGIAGNKGFVVITLYKNRLSSERGFIRKLAGIFEDNDIALEHIPSGIDTVSAVIKASSIDGKLEEVLSEIKSALKPDVVEVFDDMALIATVGCGMSYRKGVSAKLFGALASGGVNIRMIDQGSSEMNIIVGVTIKDFEKAIKAIYKAFIG